MAKINLLPWRAERRKLREREFYTLIGISAAAAALIGFGISWQYGRLVEDQIDRNAFVQEEITKLDGKISEIEKLDRYKERLLSKKEAIEKLQSKRWAMVHLFDDLVRTLPDGIKLTGITQEGDVLSLSGLAESQARVSAYMLNFNNYNNMMESELEKVEKSGNDQRAPYVFSLRVKMKKAEGEGEGEEGEGTDTAATGAKP